MRFLRALSAALRDCGPELCLWGGVCAFVLLCARGCEHRAIGAEPAAPAVPRNLIPAQIDDVQDGDTLIVRLSLGYGVTLDPQPLRLLDVDAWELTRRRQSVDVTDAELQKGKAARNALAQLIADSDAAYIEQGREPRDNYGRLLGRLYLTRRGELLDVAKWMRANGHQRVE